MEKEKIFELFEAITSSGQNVFIDDFSGWGEDAKVPGYEFISAMEGNGLRRHTTNAEYIPQYGSVRRGNHLEVQLRQNGELVKRLTLGDLFPNNHLVIVTSGESLRRFAPIFNCRSEVIDWCVLVHDYCVARQQAGNPTLWCWKGDMVEMAKFFYRNNSNRVDDRSIYDYLTEV